MSDERKNKSPTKSTELLEKVYLEILLMIEENGWGNTDPRIVLRYLLFDQEASDREKKILRKMLGQIEES